MLSRIIPVSSGKGGVGKTTVATNVALSLSRYAPTILVDLDTGTSSVRNTIGAPVNRDLYHFFRKGYRLSECVTTLPDSVDPRGIFKDFGFVAGPLHLIDEITNFNHEKKRLLSQAINELPATYVILDLKAGLDNNVIDFLPYSNSGLLVFTPHLPSATLAASDIVKAILFRKLRIVFSPMSPFYDRIPEPFKAIRLINELLDRVEDVYDPILPNLDAFLLDLATSLGPHPIIEKLSQTIEFFRVYFVLNLFNGVSEVYDTAIKPFVENIITNVSERLILTNLGWIVKSNEVHQGNCHRQPILMKAARPPKPPDSATQGIDLLIRQTIGLPQEKQRNPAISPLARRPDPDKALTAQLDVLQKMYHRRPGEADDPRDNFEYITSRIIYLLKSSRISEFGMPAICSPEEILRAFFPDPPEPLKPVRADYFG